MFIDIRKAPVEKDASYFVDTNVWYWTTYVPSKSFLVKSPKDYQVEHYPSFIESVLNNKATLYYSPLILVELTGLIERSEWEIYKAHNNDQSISIKRFRAIKAERKAVLTEVKAAWSTIQTIAKQLPANIEEDLPSQLINIVENHQVDGYDALYCHFMKQGGLENIITDDKDFRGVDNIKLYSCYEK